MLISTDWRPSDTVGLHPHGWTQHQVIVVCGETERSHVCQDGAMVGVANAPGSWGRRAAVRGMPTSPPGPGGGRGLRCVLRATPPEALEAHLWDVLRAIDDRNPEPCPDVGAGLNAVYKARQPGVHHDGVRPQHAGELEGLVARTGDGQHQVAHACKALLQVEGVEAVPARDKDASRVHRHTSDGADTVSSCGGCGSWGRARPLLCPGSMLPLCLTIRLKYSTQLPIR
jgi:hypothetical protein